MTQRTPWADLVQPHRTAAQDADLVAWAKTTARPDAICGPPDAEGVRAVSFPTGTEPDAFIARMVAARNLGITPHVVDQPDGSRLIRYPETPAFIRATRAHHVRH